MIWAKGTWAHMNILFPLMVLLRMRSSQNTWSSGTHKWLPSMMKLYLGTNGGRDDINERAPLNCDFGRQNVPPTPF